MGLVPIERVGAIGMISDLANHSIPPEAWSSVYNVRFRDGLAEKFDGWQEVMNPPTVPPSFVMNADNAGDSYWFYASAIGAGSRVFVHNSGTHSDISKAGNYNVPNSYDWSGAVFQGIPIFNPASAPPQYWAALNVATDLADFPAWPANHLCKVIRVFKNYIIALSISDASDNYIHRVMWSDGADPGTMPISWDVTDPAVEASHRDLSDIDSGGIVSGLQLKDFFVIYKNESTWLMRYIGGSLIMSTNQALQKSGLLAVRCVSAVTLPKQKTEVHFLHNGIELGVFDGQGFEAITEKKIRQQLARELDPAQYQKSYTVIDTLNHEAIFAYPSVGATNVNRAVVWNYIDNTVTFRDFVGVHAAQGVIEGTDTMTWDADATPWDASGIEQWQESQRRKIVIADPIATKLYRLGGLTTQNGVSFDTSLKRRGLSVIGTDRAGEPVSDMSTRKMTLRIWPKLTDGPIQIRVGGEEYPHENDDESGLVWLETQTFDPSLGVPYCDFIINTRLIAIEYMSETDKLWKLAGYSVDVLPVSEN